MAGVLVRPLQLLRSRPRNTLDRLNLNESGSKADLKITSFLMCRRPAPLAEAV
jgi:hypothetical protein